MVENFDSRAWDFGEVQRHPEPSDLFYLEKLLDYMNARRMFVERSGRVLPKDSYRRAKARVGRGELKVQAHSAHVAFLLSNREGVDVFLRHLFSSWPNFPEEWQSALREALFAELACQFRRPAKGAEGLLRDPPPWLAPESSNPKAYLAKRIFMQGIGILRKRSQLDALAKRIAEYRDEAIDADLWHKEHPWVQAIKRVETELPGSATGDNQKQDELDQTVSDPYDEWEQALERVATKGREPSRERARILQRARREGWEVGKVIDALGGDNAWRAIKNTLRNETKRNKKTS
jgi:hypothetical protein